ncbi:hypothetical protein [Glaciimonas sp. PAMC28666]|uniref:hypothetical protein n=1 Tax=Glaciimonas sp. PAMC28666 TaxID=2807626 RepID=UPI001962FA86|nr:hypothetical protein [Glaciimonas sp. PAMC28666]QRX84342.1 hypothetical protein JQN73_09270 [Glaciimonas sp. PAMC28666]
MNEQPATNFFWDDWKQEALAAGIAAPLAALGSDVLRLHRLNRWGDEFLGTFDDAPNMLTMCLEEPAETELMFIENLNPYDTALIAATKIRLGLK